MPARTAPTRQRIRTRTVLPQGVPKIDDPGAYTKAWSVRQEVYLRPDWEPLEFICGENNRDIERLPGGHVVVPNVEAAAALGIPLK